MRIALLVEYDGTNYFGFQKQKLNQTKTIQYHIDQSIKKIANHDIKTACGGRTDTGVHACNQVIHFDTSSKRSDFNWLKGINTYLPPDIFVKNIFHVDNNFHARFCVISRTYRYVIYNNILYSPLNSRYALHYQNMIDVEKIEKSFKYFIGENDFSSFRGSGCSSPSSIKNIKSMTIKKNKDKIYIEITANSFLYHMVRNMVGFFIDIGFGKISLMNVKKLIHVKDRRKLSKTVSPCGLFLTRVNYPSKYKIKCDNQYRFII